MGWLIATNDISEVDGDGEKGKGYVSKEQGTWEKEGREKERDRVERGCLRQERKLNPEDAKWAWGLLGHTRKEGN